MTASFFAQKNAAARSALHAHGKNEGKKKSLSGITVAKTGEKYNGKLWYPA